MNPTTKKDIEFFTQIVSVVLIMIGGVYAYKRVSRKQKVR